MSWMAPRLLTLLLPVLLLGLLGGCGAKRTGDAGEMGKSDQGRGRKKSKLAGTQRPYVIKGITYYPIPSARGYVEQGIASWYGEPFHGRKTSNGEIYDMYGDTAAHKTLPMDTMLLVKNLQNGRSTVVRINDRGPFVQDRIIDLTFTKAQTLGLVGKGTAPVEIVALAEGAPEEGTMVAATPAKPTQAGAAASPEAVKKPPHKAPPIPDFDKGNFYVQVGAFDRVENARLLAKAFAKRGRDVVIQQYPAAGMNLYRVLIFASHSLAQAKLYEKRLEAEGFRYALLLAR